MKRCLALAGLLAAGQADAQVLVFGILDTFITHIDAEGTHSTVRLDASGLLASRVGVRGTESLGGGWRTSFMLEAGLNGDDGSQADGNRLFNRQAWVGLAGPMGEFRLGRQNTPQFVMNGRFDAFTSGTQASGWNNMAGAPPRVDAALGWFLPEVAGVKFQLLAGKGAQGGAAPLPQVDDNAHLHLAAEYERGDCYAGTNFERVKSSAGTVVTKRNAVGASCWLTPRWQLFGAADYERNSSGTLLTHLYSISLLHKTSGQWLVSGGFAWTRDAVQGTGHGNAEESSMMLRYLASRRTTLYGAASSLRQHGTRSSFVLGGAAVVAPGARIAAASGGSLRGLQAGILHTF